MAKANCNWWQYARWVYLVGRSGKFRPFTADEIDASVDFIKEMLEHRPWLTAKISACILNVKYTVDGEPDYAKQNWYALAKMLQKIGRDLKCTPPSVEEKTLCDALFEATDSRRHQFVKANSYKDAENTGQEPEQTIPAQENPEEINPDDNTTESGVENVIE